MRNTEYNAHKALEQTVAVDGVKRYAVYNPAKDYTLTKAVKKVHITRWEQSATSICSGVRREQRKADLAAANKVRGKTGGFLRSAAMKALNNLSKLVG